MNLLPFLQIKYLYKQFITFINFINQSISISLFLLLLLSSSLPHLKNKMQTNDQFQTISLIRIELQNLPFLSTSLQILLIISYNNEDKHTKTSKSTKLRQQQKIIINQQQQQQLYQQNKQIKKLTNQLSKQVKQSHNNKYESFIITTICLSVIQKIQIKPDKIFKFFQEYISKQVFAFRCNQLQIIKFYFSLNLAVKLLSLSLYYYLYNCLRKRLVNVSTLPYSQQQLTQSIDSIFNKKTHSQINLFNQNPTNQKTIIISNNSQAINQTNKQINQAENKQLNKKLKNKLAYQRQNQINKHQNKQIKKQLINDYVKKKQSKIEGKEIKRRAKQCKMLGIEAETME
ncbi:hypothetical protein ABPG74_013127 [Tetrahymena malaccensis]